MKKSEKRLLISEIILMIIALFSSYIVKVLTGIPMVIFMLVIVFFFKKIFGFEKNPKEYNKDYILEISVFLLTFFIIYYIFGIAVGLTRNSVLLLNVITTLIYAVLREVLRFNILSKVEFNKLLKIVSLLFFIVLDLCYYSSYVFSDTKYYVFVYILIILVPIVSNNIINSLLIRKTGIIPILFYTSIISIYKYLFPVLPNIPVGIEVLVNTILPVLFWVRMNSFDNRVLSREKNREYNKINLSILLVPVILIGTMIYFYSGYFRYYAIAIGTDNMSPAIKKGDIVIVDQNIKDYSNLKVGEVLAYKKNGTIIIHRIVQKTKHQDEYAFYTIDDINPDQKDYVTDKEIIGLIHLKIRYLGYPTLWFNN